MDTKLWGHIHFPCDSITIKNHLSKFTGYNDFSMCELGVADGKTGCRMVEFLKTIDVKNIKYFGVDDLSLIESNLNERKIPIFEFDEMVFVDGDRKVLDSLPLMNFGFVDACHCAECVYHDAIAMSKIVKVGGTMAFHDTSLMWQYPQGRSLEKEFWQHGNSTRPIGVVEGIVMGRGKWDGEWNLVTQEGDDLIWGGLRIYEKIS